eukprot:908618-Pelagomonas_calceolata.AAC.1
MDDKCWTAQLIQGFQGLRRSEIFEQAVRSGSAISVNDFTAYLRYRLQGILRGAESVDPRGNNNKLDTYHGWFVTPFASSAHQIYVSLPRYLKDFPDLPKQVVRNACQGVLAIKLKVKRIVMTRVCCDKSVLQNTAEAVLRGEKVLMLWRTATSATAQWVWSWDVKTLFWLLISKFVLCAANITCFLSSSARISPTQPFLLHQLLDLFLLAKTSHKPISQTIWLKVIPHSDHTMIVNQAMIVKQLMTVKLSINAAPSQGQNM